MTNTEWLEDSTVIERFRMVGNKITIENCSWKFPKLLEKDPSNR